MDAHQGITQGSKTVQGAKLKKNITIIIMKHSPKANATVKYYVKLPVFSFLLNLLSSDILYSLQEQDVEVQNFAIKRPRIR